MAVTSLWRIKGRLDKVVNYAKNPEKTKVKNQDLSSVIKYAIAKEKTVETHDETIEILDQYVTTINCNRNTAIAEMTETKKRFGKTGGTIAYHGYVSFDKGEVNAKTAHKIGVKLAQKLWGDRYEVVVATHLDKETHMHCHFVLNTVSCVDGKKYHRTKADYDRMQMESDKLCREYSLSVIETKKGRGKHYAEYQAEKDGKPTYKNIVKKDVDSAILEAYTDKQFEAILRSKGYEVEYSDVTGYRVKAPGAERFSRLWRRLGEDYSPENIMMRIISQNKKHNVMEEPNGKSKSNFDYEQYKINLMMQPKIVRLYHHYQYLMGIIPVGNAPSKRVHFLMKAELIQLDKHDREIRFLVKNKIDDTAQLAAYKENAQELMSSLSVERKTIYNNIRHADPALHEEMKKQISALSEKIKTLREEIKLCETIPVRAKSLEKAIRTQEKEDLKPKEEIYADGRRSSRSTGQDELKWR